MQETIKFTFPSQYFDALSTLDCGQIFRFCEHENGFIVFSKDKAAYVYSQNEKTTVICEKSDEEYFYNFFDLDRDYKAICDTALEQNIDILSKAVGLGKGIRILNQDREEMFFSFMISQNNNIPRIKGIIEKLCMAIGEKRRFLNKEFYSFPSAKRMAEMSEEFYQKIGLGYRAKYIKRLADDMANGLDINAFEKLDTKQLKKQLVNIYGIGGKVADCISLFGYHRSDSFPVDTWIEKVYIDDFKGLIKDRNKIADYFANRFGNNAGYYQQYLFYYKRMTEK